MPSPFMKSPPWHMKSLIYNPASSALVFSLYPTRHSDESEREKHTIRWNLLPLYPCGRPNWLFVSPVQNWRKFSAVLGTRSAKSSNWMRPNGSPIHQMRISALIPPFQTPTAISEHRRAQEYHHVNKGIKDESVVAWANLQ